MHVGGAHYNDESNIFKIINSINYGMNGACGGGVWGLGQLQDYSRWPRGQCAFVSSKSSSSTSLVVPPHPQVPFQQVPQISIVTKSTTTMEPSIFQNIILRFVDQLVQCPWEQNPPMKA
jgi:hypothetical protein